MDGWKVDCFALVFKQWQKWMDWIGIDRIGGKFMILEFDGMWKKMKSLKFDCILEVVCLVVEEEKTSSWCMVGQDEDNDRRWIWIWIWMD